MYHIPLLFFSSKETCTKVLAKPAFKKDQYIYSLRKRQNVVRNISEKRLLGRKQILASSSKDSFLHSFHRRQLFFINSHLLDVFVCKQYHNQTQRNLWRLLGLRGGGAWLLVVLVAVWLDGNKVGSSCACRRPKVGVSQELNLFKSHLTQQLQIHWNREASADSAGKDIITNRGGRHRWCIGIIHFKLAGIGKGKPSTRF